MNQKEEPKSELQKKIEQAIRRNGEDSHFIFALKHHLQTLKDSKPEEEIETQSEMCRYLLSKMFLDKLDLYPNQPFQCNLTENSDWPVMPLPSGLFGKEKQLDNDRKMWFYSNLHLGDVLDCRVSSAVQNSFQLRVIHKYDVTKLLDDLQLMVSLCCTKNEIQILEQKPLLVNELVRVAVLNIDKADDQIKVGVTVDKDALEDVILPFPKLGRISESDLPVYAIEPPDTERFSSYSDYLNRKPQFHNIYFHDKILEKLDVDPKIVFNYFPQYNQKPAQILLKESKLEDAKRLANSALKELEKKQYEESLKAIESALKICPTEDPLMINLYNIRSDIYAEQEETGICLKSIIDLEQAVKLMPKDQRLMTPEYKHIKEKFLEILFKAANKKYRNKEYKKALEGFELILEFDQNHHYAATAVEHLKSKHADQVFKLED